MSYILEALKKSDQQRQRGATPTLPASQVTAVTPKQPLFVYYSLLAVVLLGAGIMIGWLRPWQAEQPLPAAEPIVAKPPILISQQATPVPLPAPPEMVKKTARELLAPNSTSVTQPVSKVDTKKPDIPVHSNTDMPNTATPMPEKPVSSTDVAHEQKAIPLTELPLPVQHEIPSMTVQLHAYSNKPMNRLVSINSRMLHEGESLLPGLTLEQITPDGLIFSYKGYRFQRGIR